MPHLGHQSTELGKFTQLSSSILQLERGMEILMEAVSTLMAGSGEGNEGHTHGWDPDYAGCRGGQASFD